jgi:hypothetical protein
MRKLVVCICLLSVNTATAVPPGFAKRTLPLDAPPVGLAFDADGVLYALEGAAFNDNVATMRVILPNGTFGASFSVVGDDSSNFFVGAMAYDPISDRLLITDNTADGRLYAVGKTGGQTTISAGLAGAAGVAVRSSGEIFVSTSPFFAAGEVLQIDRANGDATSVLGNLGYGAGLVFDLDGYLVVQDANTSTFQGRLQRLPVSETSGGLTFGTPVPLVENMQSSAGITIDGEGDMFTTGAGGLYEVAGSPLAETTFDANGNPFQFATAIAFSAGSQPFERFAGANGGRLAYMADFGFASQDEFITILTPAQPGDYNADGLVNAGDYATWRGAFGSNDPSADGNGDGTVDAADYLIWRKNAGTFSASAGTDFTSPIPEPTPVVLMGMAIMHFGLAYRWYRALPNAEFHRSQAKRTAPMLERGSRCQK